MTNPIEQAIADVERACESEPPDWDLIRSATMSLDTAASTPEKKAAVERLKRAGDRHRVRRALDAVRRAFLSGKPGPDGWPRRF